MEQRAAGLVSADVCLSSDSSDTGALAFFTSFAKTKPDPLRDMVKFKLRSQKGYHEIKTAA
jgi:hypothetical protein